MNPTLLGLSIAASYSLVFYLTWLSCRKLLRDGVSASRPATVKLMEPCFAGTFLLSFFTIFDWPFIVSLLFLIALLSNWNWKRKNWLKSLKRLIPIIMSILSFWFLWKTAFP
jgi:hypothetical protein